MIYGLIAEKLGHSFSKDIHSRLFGYDYELKELPRDELDAFLKKREFKGINVTIPYKESVIPYLDYISDEAAAIGAVNTIVNDGGILKGYNTDFSGLCALIDKNRIELKDKKVLILGSGGTSKTAQAVARYKGARAVLRVSREAKADCITYTEVLSHHTDADVIINTTPVGMYPNIGRSPIDLAPFSRLLAVVDVVYNPLRTKLVCDAKGLGIPAVGGLYMLVRQAADAGEKFLGEGVTEQKVDTVFERLFRSKQNIVLIGMPGSGKTTVGRLIAEKTGMTFIDSDEEIIKREARSIPEIFRLHGEEGFRRIESEVIASLSSLQNAVIATGGGAVLNAQNIELLKENGRVYFIDRALEDIVATDDRPLSSNRADLKKRYDERYSLYCSRSDVTVAVTGEAQKVAQNILGDFYL